MEPERKQKTLSIKSLRRIAQDPKTAMRTPLKMGDIDEKIIHRITRPTRAAIHVEKLMQSTNVVLNDPGYMNTLYKRILDEEQKEVNVRTKRRQEEELKRVKKLVLSGKMKPPAELYFLKNHPVFKIAEMTKKLEDVAKGKRQTNDLLSITPVEPFAYDGNKFFKELHRTGQLWVPSDKRLTDGHDRRSKHATATVGHVFPKDTKLK